jgi:hypothetical protein
MQRSPGHLGLDVGARLHLFLIVRVELFRASL